MLEQLGSAFYDEESPLASASVRSVATAVARSHYSVELVDCLRHVYILVD